MTVFSSTANIGGLRFEDGIVRLHVLLEAITRPSLIGHFR